MIDHSKTPEDILTVKGWYSTPDPDDDDALLIRDSEHNLITTIYTGEAGISIAWGQTTVAMATLAQAFSWVVSNERPDDL